MAISTKVKGNMSWNHDIELVCNGANTFINNTALILRRNIFSCFKTNAIHYSNIRGGIGIHYLGPLHLEEY